VPSLLDLDVRADNLSKHITLAEAVISNMQSSNLFPDGCHPGAEAHKDLYDRISSILQ
jgi:phospholipase/lecithinase/hemolysin